MVAVEVSMEVVVTTVDVGGVVEEVGVKEVVVEVELEEG